MKLTDKSLMPFGVHKGTALANVPASYLLYIYNKFQLHENMKQYIQDNLEALQAEARRAAKERNR